MKNEREIADSIFARREQYILQQKKRRKNAVYMLSSVCGIALLSFGLWKSGVFDRSAPSIGETPPSPEVIYSEQEYTDSMDTENLEPSADDGTVQFSKELREAMAKHADDDVVFAVAVRCTSASRFYQYLERESMLIKEVNECQEKLKQHEFDAKHRSVGYVDSDGNPVFFERECEECDALVDALLQADARLEQEREAYLKDTTVFRQSVEHFKSLGLSVKTGTIVWTSDGEIIDPLYTSKFILLHFTAEQLESITALTDMGLYMELAPSWMDTDENTVYHQVVFVPEDLTE